MQRLNTERFDEQPAAEGFNRPPQFVKVEANLLRLPLFALHTKGLKNLDGLEIHSQATRNGQTRAYTLRVTRNTASSYPGPLARAAHLAFLSILTERGLPGANPVSWTWRDLCRRIGISSSGRTVQHLKRAIQSTAGLMIHSEDALFSKPTQAPIRTERGVIMHLYEKVAFVDQTLADGSVADANHLWLSDWYLANLNAFFTAPLDHELWKFLDRQSSVASRLYEFLLLNFYAGSGVFRVNYPTLTQFMPLRPKRHFSEAVRQFEPALELLNQSRVIGTTAWQRKKYAVAQVQMARGDRLPSGGKNRVAGDQLIQETFSAPIEVRELRHLKPPEWAIVENFYQLWTGSDLQRPRENEVRQARELVEFYGAGKAKALIPLAVKRMRQKWPDAKTFGAVVAYLPEAAEAFDRQQRVAQQRRAERLREAEAEQQAELGRLAQQEFNVRWQPVWDGLSAEEQTAIRERVLAQKQWLAKIPRLLGPECLKELSIRFEAAAPGVQTSEKPLANGAQVRE